MIKYDEMITTLSEYTFRLYERYDIDEKDMAILADTFKWFAGEYHRLVEAGEIPERQQYKQDTAKGIDAMNEALGEEL